MFHALAPAPLSLPAMHALRIHAISPHPPTRVPTSPLPHMCAWDEHALTATLDGLAHNGVLAMLAVYSLVAWQLWRAHQERHRD
jgi:hypothetical protein